MKHTPRCLPVQHRAGRM